MSRLRAAMTLSSSPLRRMALVGAVLAAPLLPGSAFAADAKPAEAKPPVAKASIAKPQACYTRSEHAAEQLIRMHTEMMVVGLTCKSVVPEKNPFGLYQDFSIKHRALLSSSEATMIGHYKKTSGSSATKNFDSFRTELANEISRRAATIGIPQYCESFVDRSKAAAKDLNADDLRVLTSDEKNAGLMHLASKPLCDVKVVSVPDTSPFQVAQAAPATAAKPAKANKPKPAAKAPAKPKVAEGATSQTVAAR
ncbi:hypothetical protein [Azospirillum griseum]|uniref:Uncharacterized protein n=1 Tax=Azospirillum griseum TaxID=2496639 RepID=A0A3S0ICC5_9PROT|nr:hypothetical protein [Azospirillum griseum]RTR16315.1 hypothetical protein EJ903_21245 [Azospirillum griseum]